MPKAEPSPASSRKPSAPSAAPAKRRTVQILLLFVSCVLVVDALIGNKGLIETRRARRQHDELVGSIARLRGENARLREEARRLREDPRAIEEVARRELGLMRPGELLFIIKDIPSPAPRPR